VDAQDPEGGDSEATWQLIPDVPGYTIIKRIGGGAFGHVYLASSESRADDYVALKVLKVTGRNETRRFLREHELLLRVRHPNIVTVYEAGVTGDQRPFIAMELLGLSLLGKPLGRERLRSVADQVAKGLEAIHEAGLIHRDIKPGNLLRELHGDAVKIADFGIAVEFNAAATVNFGSAAYTPPEILDGGDATKAWDLWSFAVTLYQLTTGRLPFAGIDTRPGGKAIRSRVPLPTDNPYLDRFFATALAKEPKDRPQDLASFVQQFHAALDRERGVPRRSVFAALTTAGILCSVAVVAVVLGGAPFGGTVTTSTTARPTVPTLSGGTSTPTVTTTTTTTATTVRGAPKPCQQKAEVAAAFEALVEQASEVCNFRMVSAGEANCPVDWVCSFVSGGSRILQEGGIGVRIVATAPDAIFRFRPAYSDVHTAAPGKSLCLLAGEEHAVQVLRSDGSRLAC
jgi:hypothetical protein